MSLVEIPDELWEVVQPLIPVVARRFRHPGRNRLDDRQALNGILFVLHTGIAWHDLPREFGYGSGVTCWRRLREWQQAGVWEHLHHELLGRLHRAGELDWSRTVADSSHIRALLGAPNGAIPGRSWPRGLKAPPPDRRHGSPAGVHVDRRQPQRHHAAVATP
jgi:transposase